MGKLPGEGDPVQKLQAGLCSPRVPSSTFETSQHLLDERLAFFVTRLYYYSNSIIMTTT
jgi:hypothetical protein